MFWVIDPTYIAPPQLQPTEPVPGVHIAAPQPAISLHLWCQIGAAARELRVKAAQLGKVVDIQQQTAPATQRFGQAPKTEHTMDDSGARFWVRALWNSTAPQPQQPIVDTYIFDNSDLKKETSQQEKQDFENKCKNRNILLYWGRWDWSNYPYLCYSHSKQLMFKYIMNFKLLFYYCCQS